MTSRRLNATEKQEIVALYRQSGETAVTLADRFGVSNSTIGRILKGGMSVAEYDALVQQKRGRGSDTLLLEAPEPLDPESLEDAVEIESAAIEPMAEEPSRKPRKRIITPNTAPIITAAADDNDFAKAQVGKIQRRTRGLATAFDTAFDDGADFDDDADDDRLARSGLGGSGVVADEQFLEVAAELGATVARLVEDDDDLEDDLEEGLDEDFDEDDDEGVGLPGLQLKTRGQLTVLPLVESAMPRICYLVVDRAAELIAPPLREFGDLGSMSTDVAETRTLPVFDNHRVAKRFSNIRTQRVIKVPDSRLFAKVSRHLRAKGIKHLLVDGQVYALT